MIFCAILLSLAACKNSQTQSGEKAQTSEQSATVYACSMHPEVTGKKGEKCSKCGMALTEPVKAAATTAAPAQAQGTASIKEIVSGYLLVKNAFTADNTTEAAAAGKALEATLRGFNKAALTAEQKKAFDEIAEDATEHAEHIGANGGKIEHQREHFALLSKDIYDLVKVFGAAGQPLYQDFCPMYDKGKGAIWLSETKDITNPYYGKKMLTCGKVKEEIK
jgi:plasmid stability protein